MRQSTLLYTQFVALLAAAGVHAIALQYNLYWHFAYFDVITHFLGGIWLALFVEWLASRWESCRRLSPVTVLVAVLLLAVVQEIMAIMGGLVVGNNYWYDTSLDMFMDSIGALAGWSIGALTLQRYCRI